MGARKQGYVPPPPPPPGLARPPPALGARPPRTPAPRADGAPPWEPHPLRDRSPASRSPLAHGPARRHPPVALVRLAPPPRRVTGSPGAGGCMAPARAPPPRVALAAVPSMAIMNPIPTRTAPPDDPPSPPPRGPRRGLSVFWVAHVLCFREPPPIVPPAAPKLGGLSTARTPPATSRRHAGGLPGPEPGSNSPVEPPAGATPRSSSSCGIVPLAPSRPPAACRGTCHVIERRPGPPGRRHRRARAAVRRRALAPSPAPSTPGSAAGSPTRRRRVDASTSRASRASLP